MKQAKAVIPSIFTYSGIQKYITLTQLQKVQSNPTIMSCYLLDQSLNIIDHQQDKFIDLQEYLVEKGQGERQEGEGNGEVVYQVREIVEQRVGGWEKKYGKYEEVEDIVIGRKYWGRQYKTIRIQSDSISRDHTRIGYHDATQIKNSFLASLTQNIAVCTRRGSKWRKVPAQLLQKISQYSCQQSTYYIKDMNSRNGTFLKLQSHQKHILSKGQSYQMVKQQKQCLIQILGLYKAKRQQLYTFIAQFQKQYNLIDPQVVVQLQSLGEQQQILDGMSCMVQMGNTFKQYCFIVHTANKFIYPSLCGNNRQYLLQSTLNKIEEFGAQIQCKKGVWILNASMADSQVWNRLKPNEEYVLDVRKKHQIMIAHHTPLEMQFFHF